MKKVLILILLFFTCRLNAQKPDDLSAIKLFIDMGVIKQENNALPEIIENNLWDRLYRKMTQLINQTGIAEIGYSTFLVSPKFDVISTSLDQAGISRVYFAECELSISIIRSSEFDSKGEATFNSFSKAITGSGATKEDAIVNALNNLSPRDNDVVSFLNKSKEKINTYFQMHCDQLLKEAEQALSLKKFTYSIALYFSVPSNAPCYQKALDASEKVYKTYVKDECNKKLIRLKSYVALAQTQNKSGKNFYDSALNIMSNLDPASDKCFEEARNEIKTIEKRLGEEQKRNWELIKEVSVNEAEVKKEMYKAMGRINSTYQPNVPSTNVIIAH